jgi:hypothetical protein
MTTRSGVVAPACSSAACSSKPLVGSSPHYEDRTSPQNPFKTAIKNSSKSTHSVGRRPTLKRRADRIKDRLARKGRLLIEGITPRGGRSWGTVYLSAGAKCGVSCCSLMQRRQRVVRKAPWQLWRSGNLRQSGFTLNLTAESTEVNLQPPKGRGRYQV